MSAVQRVAIAGGGVAAMATAIALAEAGVEVTVFEAKPEVGALGSGITLQGNALRVFDRLGVWEQVRDAGYGFDGLALRAPGPDAPVVARPPDHRVGGIDYPATLGMYRPDLARILVERAAGLGAQIRLGARVTGLDDRGGAVEVQVDGASAGTFDLLVGADGVNSAVRSLVGIDTAPEPTGMGIWRAFVKRPAEVQHSELYYGGPMFIAGYTPTGADTMYAFLVEQAQDRFAVSDADAVEIMREATRAYGGPWNDVRADLSVASRVNYTWFTSHVVPAPWNRGRAVVIGDAAHSCPPTIAQGAAQALEDAVVLAELLTTRDVLDQDLWDAFHARRVERATAVVQASTQIGRWLAAGDHAADVPGTIARIGRLVSEPA
jgi:2-polyprenyl-6-methoxyphenol hydroxylase-like FAD-dependent oxidoreductase